MPPRGMALSPGKTLFLSSLGTNSQKIAPAIAEFDLATGQRQRQFPIPERYLPPTDEEAIARGTEDGLGFAALAIDAGVASAVEPWRLFSAIAVPLQQDRPDAQDAESWVRLLHYLITDNKPRVLAEHAYSLLADVDPSELVDLVVLPGNHFLSLERNALYQMETVTASDTFLVPSLKSGFNGIGLRSVAKRPLLDLNALDLSLPHLEGMTLGSRLPDGSLSLLLVGDMVSDMAGDRTSENTSEVQLLLFRLKI
ncbi:MAG: esterase-like activity of phytase family protein [Coleofasciculaceae cyanobacterium SM2_3_26]|nr:esterase-like activity of phytase family protein [Coleofasciculaceae cyanobacterium SM2_3_26]